MLADVLILAALDRADNVAIILEQTLPGKPPMIAEGNDAFHRLIDLPREAVDGEPLALLTRQPVPPEWRQLQDAIIAGEPLRGEVPCFTRANQMFWFGFTLRHLPDPLGGRQHPVLTGRDITVDRRTPPDRGAMSALLALAFAKIDAAVVLVGDDSRIIVANPTMAALTGFTVEALEGKPVHELTHPKDVGRASAAQIRQLADGERYQMQLAVLAKNGSAVSLRLTSELIENAAFGRVSIATLVPIAATTAGRVTTVSLQAARVAYGEAWERMSGRLVIMAESVIKQRLGQHDVFARSGDTDFTIWFASTDEAEISACIATITRELRIRLLGSLGENVAATATHAILQPPGPPLSRPEARPREQQDTDQPRALDVIAKLSSDTPVEITRVRNGDDQPAGLVWADLPHADRHRLDTAVASLSEHALLGAGVAAYPELLRLRFAVAGIKSDLAKGQRQCWLLPISCTALLSRKRRRQLLDALRDTPAPVRARLRALLADVPPGPLATILRDWFEPSGPLLQSIGVLSRAPDLPPETSLCTPIKLIAIDLDPGPAPPTDAIVKLLGTAHQLGLPVMVRTATPDLAWIWRDRGAKLFAITQLITLAHPR